MKTGTTWKVKEGNREISGTWEDPKGTQGDKGTSIVPYRVECHKSSSGLLDLNFVRFPLT